MFNRLIMGFILICSISTAGFSQASSLRDYVGMISQKFHPDIVSYMEQFKENLQKRGFDAAAKSIDHFLKGDSGTGFVHVTADGKNYILTNYHVISQAHTLSVTFEKIDADPVMYSDLTIIAADEKTDIALLAFAGGQNPFTHGLAFLNRPLQEGDDVYSAGFPGLGTAMIWQLGRGMVSNASVRIPAGDDSGQMLGPYIQHTAQVDPGNSGGPLLVQTQGVPAGFAVAGINTLSARFRQAANFSIPLNQVQSFLDASLKPQTGTDIEGLNARISAFIEGLSVPRAVYPHIAGFLSNTCTAENAEYALSEMIDKAPHAVQNDIVETFVHSPVEGMAHAVAWTIENNLRNRAGKISIRENSTVAIDDTSYTVQFNVNDTIISSEWINEYGIWRIRTFGNFAAGDKSLVRKKTERREADARLRIYPDLQISTGLVSIQDWGLGFGADLIIRSTFFGYGIRTSIAKDFFQFEGTSGLYIPIKAGKVAFTPYGNFGIGGHVLSNVTYKQDDWGESDTQFFLLASLQGGLQFTTAAVPGLYFQAAYQRNFILDIFDDREKIKGPPGRNILAFSIGYSF
jgi:serine protease Do